MRMVPLLMLIGAGYASGQSPEGRGFGIWKMNPVRSREPYPNNLVVRFEQHTKGEVFTLDKTGADGRATTVSTILYFDGKLRDFQDVGCSGAQSSRRVDGRTVEILWRCANGAWTQFVRRLAAQPKELVLEIRERQASGPVLNRLLVMEKQ